MGNWPSGHGQITKIWPSDRCGAKTIPAAMSFGHNLHEFGGYLGNVGSMAWAFQASVFGECLGTAGHRMAANGMQFRWWWDSGTIPTKFDVIWEMSA